MPKIIKVGQCFCLIVAENNSRPVLFSATKTKTIGISCQGAYIYILTLVRWLKDWVLSQLWSTNQHRFCLIAQSTIIVNCMYVTNRLQTRESSYANNTGLLFLRRVYYSALFWIFALPCTCIYLM